MTPCNRRRGVTFKSLESLLYINACAVHRSRRTTVPRYAYTSIIILYMYAAYNMMSCVFNNKWIGGDDEFYYSLDGRDAPLRVVCKIAATANRTLLIRAHNICYMCRTRLYCVRYVVYTYTRTRARAHIIYIYIQSATYTLCTITRDIRLRVLR